MPVKNMWKAMAENTANVNAPNVSQLRTTKPDWLTDVTIFNW